MPGTPASLHDLETTLGRIDGRGYKAYHAIKGRYDCGRYVLAVDYVQGDPFATPSRLHAEIPLDTAAFPAALLSTPGRRTALCDFLARAFARATDRRPRRDRGIGRSGVIEIDRPGQQILERTAVQVTEGGLEVRFRVGLPAAGRRILGREAALILTAEVPQIIAESMFAAALDLDTVRDHLESVEDQQALRAALESRGLVAFVADGSRLPRRSGVDDRPLEGSVVPFSSAECLRTTIDLPNRGRVTGMGIPSGVTLIVGGGYHGKSTLLRALQLGIYDHIPGDGRELVATRDDTVKIRAEDGRAVTAVDISAFIDNLPFGTDTHRFSTADASGSTSQAAAIIEALEVGAGVLLMDEDTSATNFMIRDHRMQELVAKHHEPITPFIDRVQSLRTDHGVSTVLVIGGAGDYFDVADTVVMMTDYTPRDVTSVARDIVHRHPRRRRVEVPGPLTLPRPRAPHSESLDPRRGRRERKIDVPDRHHIRFGTSEIDLTAAEQLVDASQTRAIGEALLYLREHLLNGRAALADALRELERRMAASGLDVLGRDRDGRLAAVRRFEIAAALNRLRGLAASAPET